MPTEHVPEVGPAILDDLPELVEIFNLSAASSIANFTSAPVTPSERREWFERHSPTGPHRLLVARGVVSSVLGYAASGPYRDHEAFRETVEVSISLRAESRGRGIGTRLYHALFSQLRGEPIHVAVAGIALPNPASVALHRSFGFTEVGTFREYAIKHGRYISSLWMQRLLPD